MSDLNYSFGLYTKDQIEDIYNACKLRIDDLQSNIDHLECFMEDLFNYLEDLEL